MDIDGSRYGEDYVDRDVVASGWAYPAAQITTQLMHPRRFVLADPGAAIPRFLAEVFGKEDDDVLPPKDIIRGQNQKKENSEDEAEKADPILKKMNEDELSEIKNLFAT